MPPRPKRIKKPPGLVHRVVIQHEFTGETEIAQAVYRNFVLYITFRGQEERLDERGFIAGGWRLMKPKAEYFRIPTKRRQRDAEDASSTAEASSITESDMDDFSSFIGRHGDE